MWTRFFQQIHFYLCVTFSHQCDAWSFSSENEKNDEHHRMSKTNPVLLFTVCICICYIFFFVCRLLSVRMTFFLSTISSECKYRFEVKANKRLNLKNARNTRKTWNQNNGGKQIFQSCLSIDKKQMIVICNTANGNGANQMVSRSIDISLWFFFSLFFDGFSSICLTIKDALARIAIYDDYRWFWNARIKLAHKNRNVNEFFAFFTRTFFSAYFFLVHR